ncbi:probable LRR receptor-like serine/threonine-protein kinase At2g16250 [Argentina anserina]|uniref:probable LRR receptor-like serine/threonine-protein kinase At2g16250 n=1 Tax=Argentina anserina TaxID=57926 RepID=UPI0021766E19|nr:probable LRR receptor-like serine/threonine-protein kinase At2g16250 [Potentilla anserina]
MMKMYSMLSQIKTQVGVFTISLALFFLISCVLAQQDSLTSAVERSALLDLRSSLGLRSKDWPIKAEPCTWTGVQCRTGRVVGITVSGLRRTNRGRRNPKFEVDSLANFTSLVSFNASGFSLPGSIPDWFGLSLSSLEFLDLSSASVIGAVPESLSNLTKLKSLCLSGNDITGVLPSALGSLVELEVLDVSRNSFTGSIPSEFASLNNLTVLDLSSNFLSGTIPPGLGTLSRLNFLNLSDNSLTDTIPVQLGELSELLELDLSKNALSGGALPVELGGLSGVRKMVIGDNDLEGPLPDGLFSSLTRLEVLVLSRNRLEGALPSALWSLSKLQLLDLSRNNFAGALPRISTNGSVSGAVFNLSDNFFQGKVLENSQSTVTLTGNCLQLVPNQRSSQACRQFYEERGMAFDDFGVPEPEPDSKRKNRLIYILAGIFGGLGFIVILVVVLVVLLKRGNKATNQQGSANVGPVTDGDGLSLPKDLMYASGLGEPFTYGQICQIAGSFGEETLIKHGHSGDLFHGSLKSGTPVVIKRVDLHSFSKESYTIEMDLFSKVSHTRLIPLLGHCLEHENEKLLVYKYMPNGDLASSLHRVTNSADGKLQSLDWITRLKIAIGAAEVLAYLHHDCSPPLVHRDVQASSILLDDKFEVRLGSLSEVRAQEGDANQNVITRLLRKQPSSEQSPSALMSSPTCAYDVYCFGKVLLELVTGKLGISKSDDASTREWLDHTVRYISIFEKELVSKIVDPSLIVDEDLLDEVWAMAIVARSCLNPKSSKRPPMKYILKALENPLKVVREESSSSARLQTTSSRRSWSTVFFGSWQHSSSENATVPGHTNRESISALKQSGRAGSHGSGGIEFSSSRKRLSNEIFPEPIEMQDVERQEEH